MKCIVNVIVSIFIVAIIGAVMYYCVSRPTVGIKEIDELVVWNLLPAGVVLLRAGYSFMGVPILLQPRGHFDLKENGLVWLLCLFPSVMVFGYSWPAKVVTELLGIAVANLFAYHLTIWQYLRSVRMKRRTDE